MHPLAQRVLAHIRREELLRAGDRVGVAVSGGIDSVALLRLLVEMRSELGIVLSVVHFNHRLRGPESEADEEFVRSMTRELGLECFCEGADVAARAAEEHLSVEAAARELRYGFFGGLLAGGDSTAGADAQFHDGVADRSAESAAPPAAHLNKMATGHTLDDQAETVLMRLIRGTGMRGLGGIYPRVLVEDEDSELDHGDGRGEIVRPLLEIRRSELQQYLTEIKQPWREDSSNADAKFTRNRVRRMVLPLLEREFNPAIAESLAEFAEIARGEEDYWENEIAGWLGTVVHWSQPEWARALERAQNLVQIQGWQDQASQNQASQNQVPQNRTEDADAQLSDEWQDAADASISRAWLLTEPLAAQRRLVKAIGENAGIPLEFRHIEEILRFAGENGPSGKELALPRGWKVRREHEAVTFLTPDPRAQENLARDYEYSLAVPGRVVVSEAGLLIEALRLSADWSDAEYNPLQLLDADLLPAQLTLRNWRAGDRFWPAHTKGPKKIKELLQERHLAQSERQLWPVALCGNEVIWMRGFAVPARLRARAGREAVWIREVQSAE